MKVSVMGTGYVGLVSGVCLAEKGHDVVCVDVDQAKVDKINKGIPPIYEIGLEEMLKNNIGSRLTATTDLRTAVLNSDISLIAVGTPFDGELIDLSFIKTVSRQVGEALKETSLKNGLIMRIDPTWFAVAPALIAEKSDLDEMFKLIDKSLKDAFDQVS